MGMRYLRAKFCWAPVQQWCGIYTTQNEYSGAPYGDEIYVCTCTCTCIIYIVPVRKAWVKKNPDIQKTVGGPTSNQSWMHNNTSHYTRSVYLEIQRHPDAKQHVYYGAHNRCGWSVHTHIEELESGQQVVDIAAKRFEGRVGLLFPQSRDLALQNGVCHLLQLTGHHHQTLHVHAVVCTVYCPHYVQSVEFSMYVTLGQDFFMQWGGCLRQVRKPYAKYSRFDWVCLHVPTCIRVKLPRVHICMLLSVSLTSCLSITLMALRTLESEFRTTSVSLLNLTISCTSTVFILCRIET